MNIIKLLHINSNAVCPATGSNGLDSLVRRKLQNPAKFLKPYIHKGMNVLDMGCGSGFCTFDMAGMLEGSGCVVALDLQQEMLDILQSKLDASKLKNLIRLQKCEQDDLEINDISFDFILLFYMFHEMSNHEKVLRNLNSLLKPEGRILISEPKIHVPKSDFEVTKKLVLQSGFHIVDEPRIFFSRSIVLRKHKNLSMCVNPK